MNENPSSLPSYPFAFPVIAIGPFRRDDDYYGNDVLWFHADDAMMEHRVAYPSHRFGSWLLFDNAGARWLIRGVTKLPLEDPGPKRRFQLFARKSAHDRFRYRFRVEPLEYVTFEDMRQKICDAYANRTNLIWECLAIDRKLITEEEEQAAIDGEIARLAEAGDLSDLILRLEDLEYRREAEAH